MSQYIQAELASIFLNKILEKEDMKGTGDSLKEIKEDACNIADIVQIYVEAIMRKFEPPKGVTLRNPQSVGNEIKIPNGEISHFDH